MARQRASSRRIAGSVQAAVLVALAGVTGLSLSGQGREWRDYAGGPDSSRFVAATQITKSNVSQLQVAWTYAAGQTDFNPLVVRGVVYGRGPNDSFVALDAATGKQLWIHEGVQGFNSRGVNYWESKDGKDRRLIFSSTNFLQEIDAQTGETISSFGKDGHVDLREGLDRDPAKVNQQTRTPGRVFENLIILGSATNQEYDSAPGDIRAFDVRTGKLVWTFHTVPRPGEFGYDTWPKDAWKTVGGANNWGEQSIDEKRGIVYVPTASPKYNFYGGNRPGRQSVRRLPRRARRQDRQAPLAFPDGPPRHLGSRQQLGAAVDDDPPERPHHRRRRDGQQDRLSLCVRSRHGHSRSGRSRNGRCRRRPTVPGETLWPTQPFPTSPPPFSRQKFTADDLNPYILTPEEREQFRQRILKAQKRRALHADRVRRSDPHARQPGRIELGQHGRQPGRRQRVCHRLQRADDHSPAEAGRDARRPARRSAGGREGGTLRHGRLRPVPDDRQPAVHDADRVRSQRRARSSGRSGSATICVSSVRASRARARRPRPRAGSSPTATGLVFVTAADRKVHVYDSATGKQIWELPLGGTTSGCAVDVRARRTPVPSRHGRRRRRAWRRRQRPCSHGTHRHRGVRAAAQVSNKGLRYD